MALWRVAFLVTRSNPGHPRSHLSSCSITRQYSPLPSCRLCNLLLAPDVGRCISFHPSLLRGQPCWRRDYSVPYRSSPLPERKRTQGKICSRPQIHRSAILIIPKAPHCIIYYQPPCHLSRGTPFCGNTPPSSYRPRRQFS